MRRLTKVCELRPPPSSFDAKRSSSTSLPIHPKSVVKLLVAQRGGRDETDGVTDPACSWPTIVTGRFVQGFFFFTGTAYVFEELAG